MDTHNAVCLLFSTGQNDCRHRRDNLDLLLPRAGRIVTTRYRRKWLHPDFQAPEPKLAGRRALLIFFDFPTGLFLPVRAATVADAEWCGDTLQIRMKLEGWLSVARVVDESQVPRLPAVQAESGEPFPADNRGPHAFLFPLPAAWVGDWKEEPAEDQSSWLRHVKEIVEHRGSPYASCFFLAAKPRWPSGVEVRETLVKIPPVSSLEMEITLLAGPAAGDQSHSMRLLALQGHRRIDNTVVQVLQGQKRTLPLCLEDVQPGGGPVSVELYLPAHRDTSVPLTWTLEVHEDQHGWANGGGMIACEAATEYAGAIETHAPTISRVLERLLGHLEAPRNEDGRTMLHRLIDGICQHAGAEPWLMNLVIILDEKEARRLAKDYPRMLQQASDRELSNWAEKFRPSLPEKLDDILHERVRHGEDPRLSGILLDLVRDKPPLFLKTLTRLGVPLDSIDHLIEHPFVVALDRLERIEEFFKELVASFPIALPQVKAAIVTLLRSYSEREWGEETLHWEQEAMKRGEPWPNPISMLPRADLDHAPELIRRLGDGPDLALVTRWYEKAKGRLKGDRPDLWSDVIYAIRSVAPAEEKVFWNKELARAALSTGDVFLMQEARHLLEEQPEDDELRSALDTALRKERPAIESEMDYLRKKLAGVRLLVLGGVFRPQYLDSLVGELDLTVDHRPCERSQQFSKDDIPPQNDHCIVLHFAHHSATVSAGDVLGKDRVHFIHSGKRAFLNVLGGIAETR
jgi:hypothetical protein